jgi:hypothetical protein
MEYCAQRSRKLRLNQFDAIAKGIIDVNPPAAIEQLIAPNGVSVSFESCNQRIKSINEQRRMGLPCWTKVWICSEMNLQGRSFEPAATALQQVRRLWYF